MKNTKEQKLEELCVWKKPMEKELDQYECKDCDGYDLKCPAYNGRVK